MYGIPGYSRGPCHIDIISDWGDSEQNACIGIPIRYV